MPQVKKSLYAEFAKTEVQADGTVKVYGYASSGSVDCDDEVITPDAMKAAIPDYMKFGAVREMHDAKKAAGTAIEIGVEEDGRTRFAAHVVDPVAVLKVQTGVYKGFSIGGKVTKRDDLNKAKITGIRLAEISLVDRPANPDAVMTCFKAEGGPENEEEDPVDPTDITKTEEPLNKGLYNAQRLIETLGSLASICNSAEYELQNGEHKQATIDGLRTALESIGSLAQKYLAEEVVLVTTMRTKAEHDADLEKANKAADEQKANAESAAELAKKAKDEEIAGVAELAKAMGIAIEDGAGVTELMKASIVALGAARTEVEEFKKRAAPPKGYINQVALSKAEDLDTGDDESKKPVVKVDGEVNEAASLVKAAFARPQRFM